MCPGELLALSSSGDIDNLSNTGRAEARHDGPRRCVGTHTCTPFSAHVCGGSGSTTHLLLGMISPASCPICCFLLLFPVPCPHPCRPHSTSASLYGSPTSACLQARWSLPCCLSLSWHSLCCPTWLFLSRHRRVWGLAPAQHKHRVLELNQVGLGFGQPQLKSGLQSKGPCSPKRMRGSPTWARLVTRQTTQN